MASLSLQFLLFSALVVICILPFTSTAPQAWKPQGRFGKKAAWRPQSRFGKRPSGASAFLSGRGGESGPKRAWRPSSRFGKRTDEDLENFEDMGALKRAWKPQGRFGKREDEMMDMLAADDDNKRAWGLSEEEKRAWKPQGRFGKRLIGAQHWRNMYEALKRAWKPQGRFGKRTDISAEGQGDMNDVSGERVFVDEESGETCVQVHMEDGTPMYKCFTEEETESGGNDTQ